MLTIFFSLFSLFNPLNLFNLLHTRCPLCPGRRRLLVLDDIIHWMVSRRTSNYPFEHSKSRLVLANESETLVQECPPVPDRDSWEGGPLSVTSEKVYGFSTVPVP